MSFMDTVDTLCDAASNIPVLGSVVNGVDAIGHGAMGIYDKVTGDDKGAHAQFADAAVHGVEGIPIIGQGVAIANLITKATKSDGCGYDDLSKVAQRFMFGDRPEAAPAPSAAPAPQGPTPAPSPAPSPDEDLRRRKDKWNSSLGRKNDEAFHKWIQQGKDPQQFRPNLSDMPADYK